MNELKGIINSLAGSGALSGLAGGLAGGTIAGALATKKGRKMGGTALKIGGLAAISSLAWKAYQSYTADPAQPRTPASPAARTSPTPAMGGLSRAEFDQVTDSDAGGSGALVLLRAMIAAAHADGHLDSNEQQRIFAQVDRLDLTLEEKAMLIDELRHPVSISQLAEQVVDMAMAIEVYAAALLVVDDEDPAARRHLRILADRLELPGDLVASVHAESRGRIDTAEEPALPDRRTA